MSDASSQHLDAVIAAIRLRWGPDALRPLAEHASPSSLPGIPTGHAAFDILLGDGFPRGRLAHLRGTPTSGMTTLALHTVAGAQAAGDVALYVDVSRALAPDYAVRCGVDLDRLLLVWPRTLAAGLHIARDVVAYGGQGVIVLDVMHVPEDGSVDRRGLAVALRQLAAKLPASAWALLCLTSPDSALASVIAAHADLRLEIARQAWIQTGRDVRGYDVRVTLLKHKFAPAGGTATLAITLDDYPYGDDV